jgi:hypothetical protein
VLGDTFILDLKSFMVQVAVIVQVVEIEKNGGDCLESFLSLKV